MMAWGLEGVDEIGADLCDGTARSLSTLVGEDEISASWLQPSARNFKRGGQVMCPQIPLT